MTKNPFINAVAALIYITLIASVMFFGTKHTSGPANSIIIPIAMLSLFTLSAAVMGYVFLSQPLQLYLDGKKKDAIKLFLRTIAVFAVITAIAMGLLLSGVSF